MTMTRQSTMCLCGLAAQLLLCAGVALAQMVTPQVPISITPIGATPVSLQPGGRYTFEVPTIASHGIKAVDLVSPTPSLTIGSLPSGPDGMIRREVVVSDDAPLGETKVQLVTDQGRQDVAVIVVPPTPPSESGEAHHGEGDSTAAAPGGSQHRGIGSRWGWLMIFGVGVAVGLVVRRKS